MRHPKECGLPGLSDDFMMVSRLIPTKGKIEDFKMLQICHFIRLRHSFCVSDNKMKLPHLGLMLVTRCLNEQNKDNSSLFLSGSLFFIFCDQALFLLCEKQYVRSDSSMSFLVLSHSTLTCKQRYPGKGCHISDAFACFSLIQLS